jgi:3-dehydroquinate dehydratase-2
MLKIGIINGPNLNNLGKRDKNAYGILTLKEINQRISHAAVKENMELTFIQSNFEGEIIDSIQKLSSQTDGLVINPGAYAHYSYAIADALRDCPLPIIEVHLSNIFSRDEFRQKSVTAQACNGQIVGLGYHSYILALYGLQTMIEKE